MAETLNKMVHPAHEVTIEPALNKNNKRSYVILWNLLPHQANKLTNEICRCCEGFPSFHSRLIILVDTSKFQL